MPRGSRRRSPPRGPPPPSRRSVALSRQGQTVGAALRAAAGSDRDRDRARSHETFPSLLLRRPPPRPPRPPRPPLLLPYRLEAGAEIRFDAAVVSKSVTAGSAPQSPKRRCSLLSRRKRTLSPQGSPRKQLGPCRRSSQCARAHH